MPERIQIQEVTEIHQEVRMIPLSPVYAAETGTPLGRGVFASRDLNSGEIVEVAPVVLLDLKTQPFPAAIRRLAFNWSKTHVVLALGFGSLYNHSDQPNLVFKRDIETLTITFSTLREIQPGEQLTISYDYIGPGESPRDRSWFEIHQVEKIEVKEELQ